MDHLTNRTSKMAIVAWLLAAGYYFYQYTLRSAPAVMIPELSREYGLNALGIASIIGLFYYGYSPFALIAGVSMDRLGLKYVIPIGALAVGAGAIMFATGNYTVACIGRFLQGAGGAVPLVGAVYIISKYFPASRAATLIGATQMFGMAGGFAGQFAVGPAVASGFLWQNFWIISGITGLLLGILIFILLPKEKKKEKSGNYLKGTLSAFVTVVRNPQSLLCGVIAALIFIPTNIWDMIWGVRFLQEGYGFDFGTAVLRSASVSFGWIIGCPLLGYISDKTGKRKPVILGGAIILLLCLTLALYGRSGILPPFSVAILIGIVSGAGMIPYTVIKEANDPQYSGTATGVCNFINFTISAVLGPIFGWLLFRSSVGGHFTMRNYQATFLPLLFGVGIAIILTLFLKETGPSAARKKHTV